jgi:tetratricopeptide (TPR) repeat protein
MHTKNLPVVEEDLKKAIAKDPEFALAHKELGRLYYLKNDGKNAVKHQEIFLGLTDSPDDDDQFKLAFYYFSAKDYVKANAEFKKLAAKPVVTPMTLRFYAKSLTEAGELADAEKIFKTYMETKKDSVKATDYLALGRLQQLQKKDSLWAISLETAVSMDKTQQRPLEELVAYYFKARKFGPCAIACAKLNKVKKQPDANVYFMQGKALVATKQYPAADTAFAKLIELKPAYVQGYLWAAKSKNAQDGKLDEKDSKVEWLAKPNYDKVIELGELDRENNKKELTEAYQYMVSYYFTKQDIPKGKEALKKILEINPDDKDAQEALKSLDQPAPQQKKPKKKVG